jgi:LCP family protein required for cell wall assembly
MATPTEVMPAAAAPEAARPRRWPRRLLISLNIFLAVCLVMAGSGYAYLQWRLHQVPRHHFARGVLTDTGKVMNVLLVGSDTRSTIAKSEAKKFGTTADAAGQRSDTIMILHVDPKEKKASILSLPRDLYVPIASGGTNRINSAFDKGPDNLVNTISQDFGIPINHYIEVDFNGFRGIVRAVGSVNVYFASPARDAKSGLKIDHAGCIPLDGDAALSYVRSRYYQYYEGGRWHDEGDGDIGRITRQQDFIRRVLRKVKGVRNPLTLNELIGTGIKNVTLDNGLGTGDILKVAERFKSLSPDTVEMKVLPTVNFSTRIGGQPASVLKLKQPDADDMIADFTGRPRQQPVAGSDGLLPGAVRVRVLNGAGVGGVASKAAGDLGPSGVGFNIAGTGDADSFRYSRSVITYGRGQLAKAQLLQSAVRETPDLRIDPALQGTDVVLVIGSSFTGVRPLARTTPTTSSGSPSTTAGAPASGAPTGKSAADSC